MWLETMDAGKCINLNYVTSIALICRDKNKDVGLYVEIQNNTKNELVKIITYQELLNQGILSEIKDITRENHEMQAETILMSIYEKLISLLSTERKIIHTEDLLPIGGF